MQKDCAYQGPLLPRSACFRVSHFSQNIAISNATLVSHTGSRAFESPVANRFLVGRAIQNTKQQRQHATYKLVMIRFRYYFLDFEQNQDELPKILI